MAAALAFHLVCLLGVGLVVVLEASPKRGIYQTTDNLAMLLDDDCDPVVDVSEVGPLHAGELLEAMQQCRLQRWGRVTSDVRGAAADTSDVRRETAIDQLAALQRFARSRRADQEGCMDGGLDCCQRSVLMTVWCRYLGLKK